MHFSTTIDGETTEKDLSAEVSLGLSSGTADEGTADDEEAVDFAVINVSIKDGQVEEVTTSGFIADLSEL